MFSTDGANKGTGRWAIAVAVLLAILVNPVTLFLAICSASSLDAHAVQGDGMAPTVPDGTMFFTRDGETPERNDVVVFESPNTGDRLVKRVAGVPGDLVELTGRTVLINGVPYGDSYTSESAVEKDSPFVLGPEEFFMLSDNRDASVDSRAFGVVHRDQLVGVWVGEYWPRPNPVVIGLAASPFLLVVLFGSCVRWSAAVVHRRGRTRAWALWAVPLGGAGLLMTVLFVPARATASTGIKAANQGW